MLCCSAHKLATPITAIDDDDDDDDDDEVLNLCLGIVRLLIRNDYNLDLLMTVLMLTTTHNDHDY